MKSQKKCRTFIFTNSLNREQNEKFLSVSNPSSGLNEGPGTVMLTVCHHANALNKLKYCHYPKPINSIHALLAVSS